MNIQKESLYKMLHLGRFLKEATFSYLFMRASSLNKCQDVNQIQSSLHAFAALRSDGSVVTWGKLDDGGNSSNVQRGLQSRKKKHAFFGTGSWWDLFFSKNLLKIKKYDCDLGGGELAEGGEDLKDKKSKLDDLGFLMTRIKYV